MSDAVDRWVPGQVLELRASQRKWALIGGGCLGFTAIGVAMIASGEGRGWLPAVFFGRLVVAGWQLLWPSTLRIDATGLTMHHMTRTRRWEFAAGGAASPESFPPPTV